MYTDVMENSTEFPQKTENKATIWSSNSKTSMEETKIQEDINTPMSIASFYNSQDVDTAQVSISRWIHEDVVCVCALAHSCRLFEPHGL